MPPPAVLGLRPAGGAPSKSLAALAQEGENLARWPNPVRMQERRRPGAIHGAFDAVPRIVVVWWQSYERPGRRRYWLRERSIGASNSGFGMVALGSTMLYPETSAVLSWPLRQERAESVREELERAERVAASQLTPLECRRALARLTPELDARSNATLRQMSFDAVRRWLLVEIDQPVRDRAGEPSRSSRFAPWMRSTWRPVRRSSAPSVQSRC